jgi:C1A family cysteine protease
MKQKRNYTWRPDLPDHRDHLYVAAPVAIPTKVDLTAKCYADALPATISSYQRLQSINDMLQCLAAGFPFVFGFTVYDAFESADVAKTGILNMPAKTEKPLGGHAVMAVGYDQSAARFLVQNSWWSGWGRAGRFTIPFPYLASRTLSDDFWTLRK